MNLFPSDAIRGLLDIVSSGQLFSQLRQVGQYVCTILAYFIGAKAGLVGANRSPLESEAQILDLTNALHTAEDQLRGHLEKHAEHAKLSFRDGAAMTGIDPATIAMIIQLITQVLTWIHDRRHPQPTPAAV